MEAVLEEIPQVGEIQLTIRVTAKHNFSAKAAQKLVGRMVADEIGYLLRSGEPTLVVGDRLSWRVPVILALPDSGPLGSVGTVDVNVETGELSITAAQIGEITQYAESLAAHHTNAPRSAS